MNWQIDDLMPFHEMVRVRNCTSYTLSVLGNVYVDNKE